MEAVCKSPAEVAESLACTIGPKKAQANFLFLSVMGILAGVYIAFGAQLATMVGHDAATFLGVGVQKLLAGSVFSVGLMMVVIAGAELFTGNNLVMISVLDGKASVLSLLRNWVIVYFANFAGSLLIAWLITQTGLLGTNGGAVGVSALNIAKTKVGLTFMQAFSRGILCNWLVCLAVWMALASRTVIGKIFACFFPIMAFVTSGFEHSVANMYFIPVALMNTGAPFASGLDVTSLNMAGLIRNLIPVTLGNIVGGAFFVATFYYLVLLKGRKD